MIKKLSATRKRLTFLLFLSLASATTYAQGVRSIRINEVMTINTSSIQDEYGRHPAWIELANTSYSKFNVRNMYITTDTLTLKKDMSVQERIKHMNVIPNDPLCSVIDAKGHNIFFLGSSPTFGSKHLSTPVKTAGAVWIGLYDGNAIDLIDSVTVPLLSENSSYARISDDSDKWFVARSNAVTPGLANQLRQDVLKADSLKRDDPHGIGISILCMSIVFLVLALLYIFFLIFGWIIDRRNRIIVIQPIKPVVQTAKKIEKVRQVTTNILQDGFETHGRDKEIYIAVIAMALKQHSENVHDVESGIISIKPHHTDWK